MQIYKCVKLVRAKAMTRGEYNLLRNWELPEDECPHDPGYLVEYLDSPNTNVPGFSGYVSWSPGDVFERGYIPVTEE